MMSCMTHIGKNMKNVEQDLEAKDWTAKEHLEVKPSSKLNSIRQRSKHGTL